MKRTLAAAVAALSLGWNGLAAAKPELGAAPCPQIPPVRTTTPERSQLPLGDFGEAERVTMHVVGKLPFGVDMPEPALALYRAAQTHQEEGRVDQARVLYQQIHLMSPTTWFGQQAMRQLQTLESGFATEDSEEPPVPMQTLSPRGPSSPVRPQTDLAPRDF